VGAAVGEHHAIIGIELQDRVADVIEQPQPLVALICFQDGRG